VIHAAVSLSNPVAATRTDITPCIFIVDDDVSVRESLELLIETAGWQAMPFSCAADFLACPKPSTPSCLVLDIGLPDLNGLELQHRLAPNGATTPIVFITGTGDIPMTVRAMKAGAVEFFTKPFCDEALLAAIERALQVSRATLRCEAEMAVLRDIWANYRDESFIGQFLSPRLMRQFRMFHLHDDPEERAGIRVDAIHDGRGYRRIRRELAKQYDVGFIDANIEVMDVDLAGDRRLMLRHAVVKGSQLNEADAKRVLQHLADLWSYDVSLVEVDSSDKVLKEYVLNPRKLATAAAA